MADIFEVSVSNDGGQTWVRDPKMDSDQYFHAAKKCRARSLTSGKLERISRPDMCNKVLIVFEKGIPIPVEKFTVALSFQQDIGGR